MLLSFSLQNYKGFKNKQEFSLIASSGNEYDENLYTLPNGVRVNTFACIIGPNGSGKTHLIESLNVFTTLIKEREVSDAYNPFLLDDGSLGMPTCFEALLYNPDDKQLYNYSITISGKQVLTESLHVRTLKKAAKERLVFQRVGDNVEFGRGNKSLERLLADVSTEASIISFSNAVNSEELDFVRSWAEHYLLVDSSVTSFINLENAIKELKVTDEDSDIVIFDNITNLLEVLDIPIKKITFEKILDEQILVFYHKKQNGELLRVNRYDANSFFSRGTLDILRFLLLHSISVFGSMDILIDEIDSSIHYKLASKIFLFIRSFLRTVNNTAEIRNVQTFFTTHNIHLLDKNMRRDEIFIITKDDEQSSVIHRGSEFSVRKHARLSAKYLNNEFGGLPKFLEENEK